MNVPSSAADPERQFVGSNICLLAGSKDQLKSSKIKTISSAQVLIKSKKLYRHTFDTTKYWIQTVSTSNIYSDAPMKYAAFDI